MCVAISAAAISTEIMPSAAAASIETTAANSSTSSSSVNSSSSNPEPLSLPATTTAAATSSSSSTLINGVDVGSNDEVKTYTDECEEEEEHKVEDSGIIKDKTKSEEGADESEERDIDGLQEEKSSLILDSEKGLDRHGFAASMGLHHALGMSSYLASAFPYGPYTGRSPWDHHPLVGSSPPPHAVGLRPPSLYPPLPAQYPYNAMLNADIAAWHHYQATSGALRPGSPYTLPITSANISPISSRFSPTSFLPHPSLQAAAAAAGLSPAAAAAAAAAAAHHQASSGKDFDSNGNGRQQQQDKVSNSGKHHHHQQSQNVKKEPHIKKPLNAFMLYMKEMRPVVQAECTLKESAAINQILGRRWHSLSREEQAKYYEKARVERQKHMQMYPHWNARDNYRFGLKKKKKRRERQDDPASSMKKCRARYGLDQQDQWCKPCRRKKKCVRVAAYMEKQAQAAAAAAAAAGHNNNNMVSSSTSSLHLQPPDSCRSNSVCSDDEYDDADHDAKLGAGHNGNETNSEPSVTSPAASFSLPSIGSPSGSVASPSSSQPSASSSSASASNNPPPPAPAPPNLSDAQQEWLRYSIYANYAAQQQQQQQHLRSSAFAPMLPPPPLPLHHQQQQQQHNVVGTDPRDSKHPLSVSQLTGAAAAAEKRTLLGMS